MDRHCSRQLHLRPCLRHINFAHDLRLRSRRWPSSLALVENRLSKMANSRSCDLGCRRSRDCLHALRPCLLDSDHRGSHFSLHFIRYAFRSRVFRLRQILDSRGPFLPGPNRLPNSCDYLRARRAAVNLDRNPTSQRKGLMGNGDHYCTDNRPLVVRNSEILPRPSIDHRRLTNLNEAPIKIVSDSPLDYQRLTKVALFQCWSPPRLLASILQQIHPKSLCHKHFPPHQSTP